MLTRIMTNRLPYWDFLFLPPVSLLGILPSTLVVSFLLIFRLDRRYLQLFVMLVTFAIVFIVSCMQYGVGSTFSKMAFLNVSLISLYFLYFFYFLRFNKFYKEKLEGLVKVFLLVSFIGGGVFLYSPNLFFTLKYFWSFTGTTVDVQDELSIMTRYTYLFSDPNNAACAFVSAYAYLLYKKALRSFSLYFYTFVVVLLVVFTMSTTGIIMLFSLFVVVFFTRLNFLVFYRSTFAFIVFIGVFYVVYSHSPILFDTVLERFSGSSGGSFSHRMKIWEKLLAVDEMLDVFILGSYGVTLYQGEVVRPHNIVLFLLYTFGMPFLVAFFYFFVIKPLTVNPRGLFFLFPVYGVMLLNTGFYDFRFMIFSVLLVSIGISEGGGGESPSHGNKVLS